MIWRQSRVVLPLAALLLSAGCDQDPFTLVIVEGGIPDVNQPDGCIVTNSGVEACDGADNDCDGQTDEDFSLLTDPVNCGRCGVSCQKPGMLTVCESGLCKDIGCAPGFFDRNDSLDDGCEYECTPTGEEECDGEDNDCNGDIDETFDLQTDVAHCGDCNNPCQLANAVAKCEDGTCKVQSCDGGFIDKDGADETGCEEPCERTNGGSEICDGVDNDCNGVVDDPGGTPIDFDTDPLNCGSCNVPCVIPHATSACQAKTCVLVACVDPWRNTDQIASNGCECEPEGAESCDGRDNDCDGQVDEDLPSDLGPCGESRGECEPGHLECRDGEPVCIGAKGREPEICDSKDNDCNNVIDDNLPASYGTCGQDVGECRLGNQVCKAGKIECEGNFDGSSEICDGKDNDCDNVTDDVSGLGNPCGIATGECERGAFVCDVLQKKLVCEGDTGPAPEMCADAKDSDCDGSTNLATCVFSAGGREERLDNLGTSTLGANNSTQLTVSASGQSILSAWLDRRNDRGDVFGNLSLDGGATWLSSDVAIATESSSKADPQVAWGGPSSGSTPRAYVSYTRLHSSDRRDVYVRRNNGSNWLGAQRVDSGDRDSLFLRLAVHPGASTAAADTVIVCWEEIYVTGAVRPNIYCARSTDSGASYGGKVRANATLDNAILPQVAIDDTYVYVAWNQGSAVHVARANHTAGTFSFTSEKKLSGANPAREPRLVTGGAGVVAVVWEDLPNEAPIDLYANRSGDRGATWSAAARVDTMVINGDSTDASLAMEPGANGRTFAAWEDTTRGSKDIYVNYSDNGGLTWQPVPKQVNASAPGTSPSEDPFVALPPSGDAVYVAWADGRNSTGAGGDIFVGFSLDAGDTWNTPDYRINESFPAGLAQTRTPFVAPTSGRVAVIWVDNRVTISGGGLGNGPNGDIYSSYVE